MKFPPLLFFCLCFHGLHAQPAHPPIALSNTYTLTDADGYTGINYSVMYKGPSGRMYTRTYDGEVAIHGNNYTIPLPAVSRLPVSSSEFLEVSKNEVWYCDAQRVTVLKGDTVYKTFFWPERHDLFAFCGNRAVHLNPNAAGQKTHYFDGAAIRPVENEPPLSTKAILNKLNDGALYLWDEKDGIFFTYRLDTKRHSWQPLCRHRLKAQNLVSYQDCNNFLYFTQDLRYRRMASGKAGLPMKADIGEYPASPINALLYPLVVNTNIKPYYQVINAERKDTLATVYSQDLLALQQTDTASGRFLFSGGNKPLRAFSTLKKYPQVFNGEHSQSLFALTQDSTGAIWAGNYQGGVSRIANGAITSFPTIKDRMLNGAAAHGRFVYFISETGPNKGLVQIDANGNARHLMDSVYGFYLYISRDKKRFYYGAGNNQGLWVTDMEALDQGRPVWQKINAAQGFNVHNVLTITEDTAGRVWCGHPKRSMAVVYPNGKAKTWLVERGETPFGAMSSLTDRWGTVWLGTGSKGLWYYNDYSQPPSPQACRPLPHPFFQSPSPVSALAVYKDWLVIAATDKMLLLNLDSFHRHNKVILRYLNPQEAAFTSATEQNTLVASAADNSVWFSTSDMLYQWDLGQWLQAPTYRVRPQVVVNANGPSFDLQADKDNDFAAGFQSFDLELRYLSTDGLYRYTSAALIRDGDSVALPMPSLQKLFSAKNIRSGRYSFIVEVYEADGRTVRYVYRIAIAKFLWEQWWFWAGLTALAIALFAFFINLRRKHQLAEEKAKTKEAELHLIKSETDKQLADLQLKTLSSQFRPHFILNSLNTIGAQMDDKPDAETVLSRLGESVNLIFNHTLEQRVLHPFSAEWQLTVNAIHIHRLIYLKALQVTLPDEALLNSIKDVQLPLGLLQIHVENALLHGLNNRPSGPWQLVVDVTSKDENVIITIRDNGVGRQRSAALSNFNKHGTGTKNLAEVIRIINGYNEQKISVDYKDGIYSNTNEAYGTEVTIILPKNLRDGSA